MERSTTPGKGGPVDEHRKPPVHIPLDFETAIEGLLGVKPKKATAPEKADDSTLSNREKRRKRTTGAAKKKK